MDQPREPWGMGRGRKQALFGILVLIVITAVAMRLALLEEDGPTPAFEISSVVRGLTHVTVKGKIDGDFDSFTWAPFEVLPDLGYERSFLEENHWPKNGFTNLQNPDFSLEYKLPAENVPTNLILWTSYVKKPTLFDDLMYWFGEFLARRQIEYLISDPIPLPEPTRENPGNEGPANPSSSPGTAADSG